MPTSTGWPLVRPSTWAARERRRTTTTTWPGRRRCWVGRTRFSLAEAPERIELVLHLAGALVSLGEVASAQELLAEADAVAATLGDPRLAARVTLSAHLTLLLTDATAPTERLFADLEDALPVLEEAGDYGTLALAEALRFQAHDRAGLPAPAEGFSRALEYARRSGARHLEHYVMGWICITLHRGALPVDEAIARATEIHQASTSTYVRTSAIGAIGVLRAMKGEFDEARRCVAEVRATLEELGLRQAAAAHSIAVAEVEALAGDDVAAERILRAGLEALTLVGDEHSKTNVVWRLALVLAHQERYDEADPFVRAVQRSEHHGFWIDVWWRVVLALIEARRGNGARTRELVDQARPADAFDGGQRNAGRCPARVGRCPPCGRAGRRGGGARHRGGGHRVASRLRRRASGAPQRLSAP